LGEIHTILGRYKKADLLHASESYGVSEHVRTALRALAQELDAPSSPSTTRGQKAKPPRRTIRRNPSDDWRGEASSVLALVQRSPYFESNQGLLKLARELGFNLQAKKDSRERLSRKLAAYIESLPGDTRDRVLSDLLAARNSQTHGWVNVIKNTR
jgi:hypothetical protein